MLFGTQQCCFISYLDSLGLASSLTENPTANSSKCAWSFVWKCKSGFRGGGWTRSRVTALWGDPVIRFASCTRPAQIFQDGNQLTAVTVITRRPSVRAEFRILIEISDSPRHRACHRRCRRWSNSCRPWFHFALATRPDWSVPLRETRSQASLLVNKSAFRQTCPARCVLLRRWATLFFPLYRLSRKVRIFQIDLEISTSCTN